MKSNRIKISVLWVFLLTMTLMSPIQTVSSWDCTPYARAWGGLGFLSDQIHSVDIEYNTPFAFGAAVGVAICKYNKIEIEALYLQGSIKEIKAGHIKTGLHGHIWNVSGFVNLIGDIPLRKLKLTPYIGIGGGYGYEKIDICGSELKKVEENDSRFVYQAIVGAHYPLRICGGKETLLTVDFRYFVFDEHVNCKLLTFGLMQLF